MDRRVSLPSFNEIARALPRPAPHSASAPQPIPYDRATYKSPGLSPHHHQNFSDSAYSSVPGGESNACYALGAKPANYDPTQAPQPHSFPTAQSHHPHSQAPHYGPASPPLHPHVQQTNGHRRASKVSYGGESGMIAVYESHQSQAHGHNVHAAAQMAGNSMERPAIAPTTPSSSLPQQPASFMHSPLSSRYAPYHMPGAPPLPASLPSPAATRISPPLSPTHRHLRSVATDASRAGASPFVTQRRHSAANTAAVQIPRPTAPPIPAAGAAPRHLPLHHLREHSVPELIGERDDEDEDDESLGYDDPHQGSDKMMAADGSMMSSAKIRTIHKLAERRRRREMKNLFDTLRKCLPIDKTIRLSKWEVLKKAIDTISNQGAEIHMLRQHIDSMKALSGNASQ